MNDDSALADARLAHREYLDEAQRLIDEQVDALFQTIAAAAERIATGARRIGLTRDGHTLTVSANGRAAVFQVEAITDMPDGSDRALKFATGQARCVLQAPDGTTYEWVLHRASAGDVPRYAWVQATTEQPIDEEQFAELLRSILG